MRNKSRHKEWAEIFAITYGVAAILAAAAMFLGLEPDQPRFGSHAILVPVQRTSAEILGWVVLGLVVASSGLLARRSRTARRACAALMLLVAGINAWLSLNTVGDLYYVVVGTEQPTIWTAIWLIHPPLSIAAVVSAALLAWPRRGSPESTGSPHP